jgi:signal transduction histidine kinase
LGKSLDRVHYVGFLLIAFMAYEARTSLDLTDRNLSESTRHQSLLRNVLWINLLVQRSTNLVLIGDKMRDPSYLERAELIASSVSTYLPAKETLAKIESDRALIPTFNEVETQVARFSEAIENLATGKTLDVAGIPRMADRLGELLNRLESDEWYKLEERNAMLLAEARATHSFLLRVFGAFLGYLLLLGWILGRKKMAERSLRESEAKLQSQTAILQRAQTLAQLGTWSFQLSDRTMVWSAQVHEILGTHPDDNSPSYELLLGTIHPDDRESFHAGVEDCIENRRENYGEFRVGTPGREGRQCSFLCEPEIDDELGVTGVLGILQDLTTRKMTETLRSERDAAEKANQAKSLFLANISHELRTPMHGILSFARFGQQKIDSAPKEKLQSYFDEIYDSGARLMNLLNDLLDLSKLEAGKIEYNMREENLVDIAGAVLSEMKAFAEERKLRLELTRSVPEVLVKCDAERIMQVLRNLVSNAVKFSEPASTIQVEVARTADANFFRVMNRGVGIPAAEWETIFDKFVQSSQTRTGAGGTGLGLAISREIVHGHSGKIFVTSVPGERTTFTVQLPKNAHDRTSISA